jgi:poly(3-hydroxybutyrate) depolymerase
MALLPVGDTCCYQSCVTLGKCTVADPSCGWSTCYDDATFVSNLLDYISNKICMDLDSVFLLGFSNGGMVSYEIAGSTLAGKVSAVLPQFALPMKERLFVPEALSGTSFLYMGGRNDRLIPPTGELPGEGWFYESYTTCLSEYAAVNGCDENATGAITPLDGENGLGCIEHLNCATGNACVARVPPSHVSHECFAVQTFV